MATIDDAKVHKTVCMLCFQVCGINAYVKEGTLLRVEGMKEHPFSRGVICPRAQRLASIVYSQDRLKYPMEKRDGRWARISWDQALDRIATKLKKIKSDFGARAVAVSVGSIGAENIAISAFAQRWRAAFGTPNYFSIEAHCFRTRIMARLLTFGTYPLEDPDHSDCILLWGHNPDASEPPLAARLYQAVDKGLVKAAATEDMRPGVINGLHGWSGEHNQNLLTQLESRDPVTGYPELRAIACRISPA